MRVFAPASGLKAPDKFWKTEGEKALRIRTLGPDLGFPSVFQRYGNPWIWVLGIVFPRLETADSVY